jgi:hypothetical protein
MWGRGDSRHAVRGFVALNNSVFSLVFKLGNMLYFLIVGLHYNLRSSRLLVWTTPNGFFKFLFYSLLHLLCSSVKKSTLSPCTYWLWSLFHMFLLSWVIQFRLRFQIRNSCAWSEVHDPNSRNMTTSILSFWSRNSLPAWPGMSVLFLVIS